jgi:hypothetical protein
MKVRVTLKRTVYAEVVVDADSVKEARRQVAEAPDEWFVTSNTIGTDIVTISTARREPG